MVRIRKIGEITPQNFNLRRENKNPRLDALKASEVVYVGNRVNGVSFSALGKYVPKKLQRRFNEISVFVLDSCDNKWRLPFLFGYEKGKYPYRSDYYDFYLKGFGWECDFKHVNHDIKLLHHSRSYKMEYSGGQLKFIALKYHEFEWHAMQPWLRRAREKGAIPKNSIPLFVSFWSTKTGRRAPFEIGFYAERKNVNELARKFRLPRHTRSLFDHDHFVVIITYSWTGRPKKVKFYYKRGYVKEDFAFEHHLVFSPSDDKYYLYDLINKKIVEEVIPPTLDR